MRWRRHQHGIGDISVANKLAIITFKTYQNVSMWRANAGISGGVARNGSQASLGNSGASISDISNIIAKRKTGVAATRQWRKKQRFVVLITGSIQCDTNTKAIAAVA